MADAKMKPGNWRLTEDGRVSECTGGSWVTVVGKLKFKDGIGRGGRGGGGSTAPRHEELY